MKLTLCASQEELDDFAKLFKRANIQRINCDYMDLQVVFHEGDEEIAGGALSLLKERLSMYPAEQRRYFIEAINEKMKKLRGVKPVSRNTNSIRVQ